MCIYIHIYEYISTHHQHKHEPPPNHQHNESNTGARFRTVLGLSSAHSDEACGRALIDRYICVHLAGHADKQECVLHMLRKLYAFVQGKVCVGVYICVYA